MRARRFVPRLAAATAGLLLVAFGACSVGDQYCEPGMDPADKEDTCPYGAPGGPQRRTKTCPPIEFLPEAECADAPGWPEVYAMFDTPTRGNCSAAACHGDPAPKGNDPHIPTGDAAATLLSFNGYVDVVNRPYAKEGDAESWILCNVLGVNTQSPMPPPGGLVAEDDIALVTKWAQCGLKSAGSPGGAAATTTTTAATAGGGMDAGAGGAGGAGGI